MFVVVVVVVVVVDVVVVVVVVCFYFVFAAASILVVRMRFDQNGTSNKAAPIVAQLCAPHSRARFAWLYACCDVRRVQDD